MRFPKKNKTARATALALALGVVGVLVTALPALAVQPTVTAVNPTSGIRGTVVTLTGTNFTNPAVTNVTVGGASAPFSIVSDTSLTATIPCAATTGATSFSVTNGTANTDTAGDDFSVTAAAAPTITSFAPTSGPVGTNVVITGTNLCGATSVLFNTTPAVNVTVTSPTSITAVVPVGATTGPIHVTTPVAPTANSATSYTVGAAPTITFSPTSGNVGTSVVITGTNLTGATSVKFNGVAATFVVNSATQITATVPTGATTGKIEVVAPSGTVTSTTDFTVTTVTKHNRTVNLNLKKHLVASGTVKVGDGFNACRANVTVKIQRLKNGVWKTVGTDQTTGNGKYKETLDDKTGKYRAIAKKEVLNGGDDICVADTSNSVRHN